MNIAHSVSFIVPCFNEEESVQRTADSIREAMGGGTFEIVFIDDCSQDATFERMQLAAAADPRIRIIRNDVNMSLGGSYKRGVAAARHDYTIMVPGDNAFPAASIRQIIGNAARADIVIPEVVNSAVRTPFRLVASKSFTLLMNWLFWLDVGYYNGAVLHRTKLLRSIDITTNGFAYQAEALVKLITRGASYVQCQVRIQERTAGRSSALRLKNQISVWVTIARLLYEVGLFRIIPLQRGVARGKAVAVRGESALDSDGSGQHGWPPLPRRSPDSSGGQSDRQMDQTKQD
jgi:glycosyltransferase involved in cell wall biosynthesis